MPENGAVERAPTPASTWVDDFVQQVDGEYGYRIRRPANWTSYNFGTQRAYFPSQFFPFNQATDGWFLVAAANLQTLSERENVAIGELLLFQSNPTLAGWTESLEDAWQQTRTPVPQRVETLPHAQIYSSTQGQEWYLAAYAVVDGQPLTAILSASEEYADLETLRETGVYTDFRTMVASLAPADSEEIEPPLTEPEMD